MVYVSSVHAVHEPSFSSKSNFCMLNAFLTIIPLQIRGNTRQLRWCAMCSSSNASNANLRQNYKFPGGLKGRSTGWDEAPPGSYTIQSYVQTRIRPPEVYDRSDIKAHGSTVDSFLCFEKSLSLIFSTSTSLSTKGINWQIDFS